MKKVLTGLAAINTMLSASPAMAAYTTSPTTLAGGAFGVLNTTTGVVSVCYRNASNPPRCASVGSFVSPSVNSRIISNEGSIVFYISDSASGRTMRCEQTGNTTTTSSGWTCALVAATLP